jgi:hypothetical protein
MNNGQGFFANDEVMKHYTEFLCEQIIQLTKTNSGATVNKTDGFPMKGCYVPIKLKVTNIMKTSATMMLEVLGHEKEFIFYMSRHKSPNTILHELQRAIDELTLEIIKDKNLNQDKIYSQYKWQ